MPDDLVLCYHAISPLWTAPLSVTPDRFEWQLRWLRDRGYRGVTFGEIVSTPGDGKRVAITFDDGFRSVGELAAPIMRELGFIGTLFVPTDQVGGPMAWPGIDQWVDTDQERELEALTWDELGGLAGEGWEIGSHGRRHVRFTTVDDEDLRDELVVSREVIAERLGRPCPTLAYPFGDHDERVMRLASESGYEAAASLPAGVPPTRRMSWPRIGVYNGDSARRFLLKVSPAIRRGRARAYGRVRRA